jgi:hypothetical protein
LDEESIRQWNIEKEFLKPVIKGPKECRSILVKPDDLKFKVFMCHKDKKDLKGTNALKYIEWGEKQRFHERPSCRGRQMWWDLGERRKADYIVPCGIREVFKVFKNADVLIDKRLYEIYGEDVSIWGIMNSSMYPLMLELKTRNYGGGGGPIDATVYEIETVEVFSPNCMSATDKKRMLNALNNLSLREIQSIFNELGLDFKYPIRDQKPNPLPDRKALDDIVFDVLGLTQAERDEVYWSVCELVKNRLDKARSV